MAKVKKLLEVLGRCPWPYLLACKLQPRINAEFWHYYGVLTRSQSPNLRSVRVILKMILPESTMLLDTLREKRTEILQVVTQHGAFNVRIFGSVVRGEETPESDIDFLIDYDPAKTTPWFPGGLLMDLQDLLGRKVDIVTERGISPRIKERVFLEAQPL